MAVEVERQLNYDQYGVLASDGERVQCHICGRWYKGLGTHAWQAHGISADEYREEFGLKYTHGLVGENTKDRMSQKQKRRWELYGPLFEPDIGMTPEKLAKVKGRPMREEARRINRVVMAKRRASLVTAPCVECGKPISLPEYRLKGRRKTCCSPECRRKYFSRIRTGRKPKPETIAKMSAHAKERHAREGGQFGREPESGMADLALFILSFRDYLTLDKIWLGIQRCGYDSHRGEVKNPIASLSRRLAGDSRFINIAPRTYAAFTPRIYTLFSDSKGVVRINKKKLALAVLEKVPWKLPSDEVVDNVLSTLSPRERAVVRLRFRRTQITLAAIGHILPTKTGGKIGVTRERVRQIEAYALRRLRHPSRKKMLFLPERSQLLRDPEWKAAWAKKISEAHGGREEVTCVICGTVFIAPRWCHRHVCSRPCLLELRRRNAIKNNVSKRPEVRAKISEMAKARWQIRDSRGQFVASRLEKGGGND